MIPIQDTLQVRPAEHTDSILAIGWSGIIAVALLLLAGLWLVYMRRDRGTSGPDDKGAA